MSILDRFQDRNREVGNVEKTHLKFCTEKWAEEQAEFEAVYHEQFSEKFPEENIVHERNPEKLLNKENFSNFTILRGLLECAVPLSEGAHTKTYEFDSNKLEEKLNEWAALFLKEHETPLSASLDIKISRFAQYLADRFVIKVGRIKEFSMVLTNEEEGEPDNIPRDTMSSAFGPAGYNLYPSSQKIFEDSEAAVALLPFFGRGSEPLDCFIPGLIKDFIKNECSLKNIKDRESDGTFVISDLRGGKAISIFDFFRDLSQENPWRMGLQAFHSIETFEDLHIAQRFFRRLPFWDLKAEKLFRDFLSYPAMFGFRPTLRWLEGEKHPVIGTIHAEKAIKEAKKKHENKNYIASEVAYETYDIDTINEKGEDLLKNNRKVLEIMMKRIKKQLPEEIQEKLPDNELTNIIYAVLSYHHDYPEFDLDSQVGLISYSTIKLAGRIIQAVSHLLAGKYSKKLPLNLKPVGEKIAEKMQLPKKRNINYKKLFKDDPQLNQILSQLEDAERRELLDVFTDEISQYMRQHGVIKENGDCIEFKRIPTTYYLFQERIAPSSHNKNVEVLTLQELMEDRPALLKMYPEIAELILDFYRIYLNYFYATNYLLDTRNDEAGGELLIKGRYADKSPNLIIKIDKDTKEVELKQVDLRDQFIKFDPDVHKRSMGIAKHGLHVLGDIVPNAIMQIIGHFAEIVYKNKFGDVPERYLSDIEERVEWTETMLSQIINDIRGRISTVSQHTSHDIQVTLEKITDRIKKLLF